MPHSPRPKYTKSSLFALSEIQKFPGKYEEILFFRLPARCVNVTFARQWYTFHYGNELPSLTCSHYHMSRKLPGKLQETSLSQPFFPSNKGRYACKLGDRFPKGILLTTHDHALLTKNFCALAPEYKGTLSHLEERAQRAHYRTCYAWHARTCADRRARRVFRGID